jgi:transposase
MALKTDFKATQKDEEIHQLKLKNTRLEHTIILLKEENKRLMLSKFGASSEKFNPNQAELVFDEAENPGVFDDVDDDIISIPSHPRKKTGRTKIPEHITRIEVVYDLADADKFCDHDGHALHPIGEEVSEQLEIIPASVQVKRTIRYKYACRHCEQGIKTAVAPKQPIPKSLASPSLLAGIVVNKYQDGLPLYRQQSILKRAGIDLPRATLANWMIRCAELLIPLMNMLRDRLFDAKLIHMDETPIQVLREPDKPATSKSYMWLQCSGEHDHPVVLYDYSPTRSGQVPIELLDGYSGLLQTDGYAGYHGVAKRHDIKLFGCWAHARRKFDVAIKANKGIKGANSKAARAMSDIQKLYRIEKQIKGKTPEEIYKIRQKKSKPIIEKLKKWLEKTKPKVTPQSLTGKALTYLDNQWPYLTAYLEHGAAAIDNNKAERAIRPFVIGRKNWLFANSVKGANASSTLYSIIETAKANKIEPWHYLNLVFKELPNAATVEEIEALLPWNVDLS